MEQDLQSIFQFPASVEEVLSSILVAFFCGLMIAFFYKTSYRGAGYPQTFLFSLVTLAMVTTIVILVIGNNLARAFGLVGAMSIIRFRTAVKETQDIMFIFFALAIGMTCGVRLFDVAIASTILIGTILVILSKTNLIFHRRTKYLLQFHFIFDDSHQYPAYLEVLKKYTRKNHLINSKTLGETDMMELSFYVEMKNPAESNKMLSDLKRSGGATHAHLFFEDEEL
jgi:uncharacterized membrane protein YhiD involved in acid resistance